MFGDLRIHWAAQLKNVYTQLSKKINFFNRNLIRNRSAVIRKHEDASFIGEAVLFCRVDHDQFTNLWRERWEKKSLYNLSSPPEKGATRCADSVIVNWILKDEEG